ncbi:MAG: class I SAM-dependent methyltransferase [Chloroflexi bacterium]|nr:class I SAM-dependent methyltransferase [Chloroflexota bacterium]
MDEITRIRQEYASRADRLRGSDLYSLFNPAQLFTIQQRQRNIAKYLRKHGFYPLVDRSILEVGCGAGRVLLETLSFEASSQSLHGTDLLFDRLKHAHQVVANLPLTNADAQNLPYASQSIDLVMQLTVFSSILDKNVRSQVAREMIRVLKPGGLILFYDFWLNPTNQQTCGILPLEIKRLFPDCKYEFHRITLAPPIARKLAPISWGLCLFLEGLGIFNTHYLSIIRPSILT